MKFLTVAFSSKSLHSVFICTSSARRKHDAENIHPFGESPHTRTYSLRNSHLTG